MRIKKNTSFLLLICLAFLSNCTKEDEQGVDSYYPCKLSTPFSGATKSSVKTLKGHILFSWKNNQGSWNYALVANLNISPAQERISNTATVSGRDCLKKNLSYLAEGEEIWWYSQESIETVEGEKFRLSYPKNSILREIKNYCKEQKLVLTLE